ncbi:ATP dependent helicase, Lhr family [Candidatus Koribacter versatilis Ellin345]|uniref:ATP dependent helicase, Lhr family n=1 Tax=Koribacter versatilis (strain Ellin345) TaxID=204669 RepID=Q1IK30_KORVE|nr:DEAD/DEAH box helicase [Candidatus Koribacter versatilis]ABF42770.1 ATP dependent helicase, Lhr family [Candidatus Koribacter versatilis Ellin345]
MGNAVPESLQWAHPLVQEWFVQKFGTPTEPQVAGWPQILAGRTTLIAAPTGSGKTLAAFLACIDQLVRKALNGELRDCTEVVYISPLKALGNDIQKNLEVPLGEIMQMAGERGILLPQIRTAVRTGDTLASERIKMLRLPPHILVTTPESLYILLTADRSRQNLRHVRTVIVDEIHAVADDKRGAHLTISLERLDKLAITPPTRIGLSATQKPIEQIAHFLTGSGRPDPAIVDVGHRRQLDIAIEVPNTELGPVASNEMWDEIYQRLADLVNQHRSTIIFVNTRRLSERLCLHLAEILGEENVAAHHGSLSRKLRHAAETKLKNGEVKALVATASLELGIDVGFVDLVCQISSPRSIAVALQRIGRAGHWRGAIPKGRIFATTRDELVECAAGIRAIHQGDLDRIIIPEAPLDILAQQIVAACSAEECDEDEMFDLVRRAYPYRDLDRKQYEEILAMLSEGIAAKRGRYGAYIHHDRVNRKLRARRGARLAAITSGGAIPETALFTVVLEPEGVVVGTVDEDFAVESMAGEIFLLGNTSWKIRRIEGNVGRILVEDAHGQPPGVPFWRGEAPARTAELSQHVSELRRLVSEMTPTTKPLHKEEVAGESRRIRGITPTAEVTQAIEWLQRECGVCQSGAEQIIEHIVTGRAVLGDVPTQQTIIAERFFDEGGGMQLIIHAPFGGRINKAWGLALRKRFCRSFNFELQAAATDDGLNIALAEQHSFPLSDVFQFLQPETLPEILEQAALASPIFKTRWRWDANRSLALLRFQNGKKVPPQIQRIRSDDLLASVFPDVAACFENIEGDIKVPDHPLIKEVMKDTLHEAMDLDGLMQLVSNLRDGTVKTLAVDTPVPSVFSHEILNANPYAFLDDAPLEERRARAVSMRRVLPDSVLEEVGRLDRAAIQQVCEEARPDVRDADELHDMLHTLVVVPEFIDLPGWRQNAAWQQFFERLRESNRAFVAEADSARYWVAAERARLFAKIFPTASWDSAVPTLDESDINVDDAVLAAATGWMMHAGPVTTSTLGTTLGAPQPEIEKAFLRLEASGTILRGKFTGDSTETEWCERRLLARIHRLTVATLRKAIEPVSQAQFMRWLLRWQHVAEGTQTFGERGLLEVVQQLQGFEIPASSWEREVLSRRVRQYDPQWLDALSLTGAVGWGRLSPHPATLEDSSQGTRRIVPTSVAPITFFVREDADWMVPRREEEQLERVLSPIGKQVFDLLRKRGACFFADIVRSVGCAKAEAETGLWELVAAGLVTADGFDNLRSLIDPKRRSGPGGQRSARPRHTSGRWCVLHPLDSVAPEKSVEAVCRMLLRRYGVVFRDLLTRESNLPRWRELQIAFRRLEDRGEIRGGRFVAGFLGEQFALPQAVESLRALRNLPANGETVTVSAADPLNLVGIIVPGERIPAIGYRSVTYRDGVPLAEEHRQTAAMAL